MSFMCAGTFVGVGSDKEPPGVMSGLLKLVRRSTSIQSIRQSLPIRRLLNYGLLRSSNKVRFIRFVSRNIQLPEYLSHQLLHVPPIVVSFGNTRTQLSLNVSVTGVMDIDPADNREHPPGQGDARLLHTRQEKRITFGPELERQAGR
jgi:hypothetical protein